jgi:hypothetical protein
LFCREQVAQLRDARPEVQALGADIVAIGSGTPAMAADFVEQFAVPFRVFVDPRRDSYRAAGLRDDLGATMNAEVLRAGKRAFAAGFRQGLTKGHPWQQGGVFVLGPGDQQAFGYVSQAAGDHPSMDAVLAALR